MCFSLPEGTLPETNSKSTWKWMVGIRSFPLGWPIFRGELFVLGSVPGNEVLRSNLFFQCCLSKTSGDHRWYVETMMVINSGIFDTLHIH